MISGAFCSGVLKLWEKGFEFCYWRKIFVCCYMGVGGWMEGECVTLGVEVRECREKEGMKCQRNFLGEEANVVPKTHMTEIARHRR